nr:ATP-binding protein [Streptomyces hygroscopicus]
MARTPPHQFSVPLSATRRGARLARLLAAEQLESWGVPLDPARLIVAELATNAVLHGRVPGRLFRLTLTVPVAGLLRVEVTDTRAEALPLRASAPAVPSESGHGLLLVENLSDRWGVRLGPVPCKTVWAECAFAPLGPTAGRSARGGGNLVEAAPRTGEDRS